MSMNRQSAKIRILVVEDEIVVSEDLQQRIVALGFEVAGAADSAAEAIQCAASTRPDVALMDIMLHGRPEGIEAAEHLRSVLDIPVIYLTAHSDAATLHRARLTDPAGYIVKPFDDAQLRVVIELAPTRHEMERKARQVARWMAVTLTSIGDAVIATNKRAEVLFLNPAAEKLTGWTQDEATGKPGCTVIRLFNQKTRQPLEDPAQRALHHGVVVRLDPDTILIARNGEERFVDDSASPIMDESGKILGAVVVLVDATERVEAQNRVRTLTRHVTDLLRGQEQSDIENTELEAFAAAVRDDLRGPFNAIAEFSTLLGGLHHTRLDTTPHRFLDRVQSRVTAVNRVMEDYLHYLDISRGHATHPTILDVGCMAQEIFAHLIALDIRNGANPVKKPARLIAEPMPRAWADEAMVRRILRNLLSNALKYSSLNAEPLIEIRHIAGGEAGFQTFAIRDNGVGLDLATATGLFEPFRQFHMQVFQNQVFQTDAAFSGSGLGLAIVKRLVEQHGGRVWVESSPGAGAAFFFTLPIISAAATGAF